MSDRPLSTKQKLFVEYYLANPNATDAARRAGYSGNDNTLAQRGAELVRNSKIRALVEKRVDDVAMTADEVLSELARIAKTDWQEFIEVKRDKHGDIVDVQLRLTDKIKALELVGKHHKLFTDKTEMTGANGGPIESRFTVEIVNSKE